ncbi:hypothetical protein ACS0TY_018528 [Phlomoides rotata]
MNQKQGIPVINEYWRKDGMKCIIINVYAPCSVREKATLWDMIKLIGEWNDDDCVCVVGDFNSIRNPHERVGRSVVADNKDISSFDEFTMQSRLLDLT